MAPGALASSLAPIAEPPAAAERLAAVTGDPTSIGE
jgi:hypothetical protein